jgi:hypothetical protein
MKNRKRNIPEKEYHIEGIAKIEGCEKYISQYVKAHSVNQAFWKLARRIEGKKQGSVYLGDCEIHITRVLPPNNADDKIKINPSKEQQMTIRFF